ncbi:hypothetical protein KY285_015997 [Solanum tuberosum]|uniref:Nonspecific lipid transfer protein n=1 Tax=Solanum tuberosum TaxID=4113 RepID=M1BFN6_SOLTU|nr:hypothetical protein KY289_016204 [Solanum tuberosum]KAH0701719.1 hypothetical protein KY285_015997 [Solanum tuberosum]
MKKGTSFVAMIFLVLFLSELLVTEAVTCNVRELIPCVTAIMTSQPPSTTCCAKLKKQKPCLSTYLMNPNYKSYVKSPNAKMILKTCGVPDPDCCKGSIKKVHRG